jgi:hypothetical protein
MLRLGRMVLGGFSLTARFQVIVESVKRMGTFWLQIFLCAVKGNWSSLVMRHGRSSCRG